MGDSIGQGRRGGQGSEERRLLKKGKRGILNVIFGRTMLVDRKSTRLNSSHAR